MQQTDIHFWSYLNQFFLEKEIFQRKVVENIKAHILYSVTFFREVCRLRDNVEKISAHAADQYKFFITSRSFLLRMRNVLDKSCRENEVTHFVFSKYF
jgi:hypothetical protein